MTLEDETAVVVVLTAVAVTGDVTAPVTRVWGGLTGALAAPAGGPELAVLAWVVAGGVTPAAAVEVAALFVAEGARAPWPASFAGAEAAWKAALGWGRTETTPTSNSARA